MTYFPNFLLFYNNINESALNIELFYDCLACDFLGNLSISLCKCNCVGGINVCCNAELSAYLAIDLSNDFRLAASSEGFVYGLPEAFRKDVMQAARIANPGCFATAIQLALLPLAKADKLSEIHVTGVTGSTGAGQQPSETTHFSWRADNLSVYKPFTHQHLGEIKETLSRLAPSFGGSLDFVPIRGCFTRGILVSAYMKSDLTEEEAVRMYKDYYSDEPFVFVVDENPDLKMVTNTNKCVVNVRKYGDNLHIISVIDNLVKGASGQAVQNMNIIFGLPETAGLNLKGNRF